MKKEKIELEYSVNTTLKILYYRIYNPSGLEEWFADSVTIKRNIYNFKWNNSEQKAELIAKKKNKFVRFRWDDIKDNSYFELRIEKRDITGDVSLYITDFVKPEEKEETKDLWEEQVNQLKRTLGV